MNLKEAQALTNAIVCEVEDHSHNPEGLLGNWQIALKDNFNMIGTKTTASCAYLVNHESIYDATAVKKLKEAGAVIVAKTSMDELGMGGTNLSAITGPVWNPYDTTRIAGGSSGGSAALVGAHVVRAAMGSDTGDSVRKPAAFCGCVGMKPTYGRISRYGVIPYASSLDHVGYFTQNVRDAAIMLEALSGRDDLDMTSADLPVPQYHEISGINLQGKRIGFLKNVSDTYTNENAIKALADFKEKLKDSGAIVVELEMNQDLLRAGLATYYMISNAEAVSNHANLDGVRYGRSYEGKDLDEVMTRSRSAGFSTFIKKRFIYGAYALNDENQEEVLGKAKKVRRLMVDNYNSLLATVDVIACLASQNGAQRPEDLAHENSLSDAYLLGENHMLINNFTGNPSITIPFAYDNAMPLGINLSTPAFTEDSLLAYALSFEALIDWKGAF